MSSNTVSCFDKVAYDIFCDIFISNNIILETFRNMFKKK